MGTSLGCNAMALLCGCVCDITGGCFHLSAASVEPENVFGYCSKVRSHSLQFSV